MKHGKRLSLAELILAPFLFVFGFIAVEGYNLLFGWWRRRKVKERSQTKFQEQVRSELDFLFVAHGARFAANQGVPEIPPFDYVTVSISVRNMILRLTRGRGEFLVDVAPQHRPGAWRDFGMLLSAIKQNSDPTRYADLPEFGVILKHRFGDLCTFISREEAGSEEWKPERQTITRVR